MTLISGERSLTCPEAHCTDTDALQGGGSAIYMGGTTSPDIATGKGGEKEREF